jgi:hypothetical protein
MTPICRTSGCTQSEVDELGYCEFCRQRYDADRDLMAVVGERVRLRYPWLFSALGKDQARALAAHAAGNTVIGRTAIWWAITDFVAEAREQDLARQARAHLTPPARRQGARPRCPPDRR